MVWSTTNWNSEFKIEFDIRVKTELPNKWQNIFHLTTGLDNGEGGRLPAVWANKEKYFHICNHVNGNTNYCKSFLDYKLNQLYHFEISQEKFNGIVTYKIIVDGVILHEGPNTAPFEPQSEVKLYLSDPWYESFGPYGTLYNFKIIDLKT